MEKTKIPQLNTQLKSRKGYSGAYYVAIVIGGFMLFYYYFTFFTQGIESAWTGAVIIALSLLIDLFLICIILHEKLLTNKIKYLLWAFLLFSIISYLINSSGLQRILTLSMFLLGIFLFVHSPMKINEAISTFWLFTVEVILILLNTATGNEDASVINKFNPNSGAFLLMLLFCASLTISLKYKYFSNKLPYLIVCVVTFVLQFVFISRTALFGLIAFFVLTLFFNAKRKSCKPKTAFWLVLVLSVLGVVIAYVYAKILYPAIGYGKIIIFGKDIFTGRQTIWSFAFDSVKEHFWFGVGSHLNEEQFNDGYYELIMNAHNQPLGLLAYCGAFVFCVFYYALSYFFSRLYVKRNHSFCNIIPLMFMCTIIVMSYFDIYFMSLYNVLPIVLIFGLITGLSKIESVKDK